MSDFLPQEVVTKILLRLPPKTLIKFRCVSKSWNSLISSPLFISMHTQQTILSKPLSTPMDQIFVTCYSDNLERELYALHVGNEDSLDEENIKIEYRFHDYTSFCYRIVGSCNGVLCLSHLFRQADSILLWNPMIKRKVKLPTPPAAFENMQPYNFVLGFGFDGKNNDYKVVKIAYLQRDFMYLMPPIVEVYALSVDNWHKVNGEVPANCLVGQFLSQVLISGNVHWMAHRNWGEQGQVENLIMMFNLSLEVFDEIELPDALLNELPNNLDAVVHKESLAVVQYNARAWEKSCYIWVMKKYGDIESWSKQYYVHLEGEIGRVIGFRTNGDVLLTSLGRGLVSYNPVTGTTTSMDHGIFRMPDSCHVGTHIESLALLVEGKEALEMLSSDSDNECESI